MLLPAFSMLCALLSAYLYHLIGQSWFHAGFFLALQMALSPSARICMLVCSVGSCLLLVSIRPETAVLVVIGAAILVCAVDWSRSRVTASASRRGLKRTHFVLLAVIAAALCAHRDFPLLPSLAWTGLLVTAAWLTVAKRGAGRLTYRVAAAQLALAIVSISFTLAAAEYTARWLFGPPRAWQWVLHPTRIVSPRPSGTVCYARPVDQNRSITTCYALSSQGLRDRVYGPKPLDEFRILLLGDSFTAGVGLADEETIARVLENLLPREVSGKCIKVVNAGVQAYGPWQELDLFREIAPLIQPDVVLLQLLLSNDIADSLLQVDKYPRAHHFRQTRSFLNYKYTRGEWVQWHQRLCGASALYRRLWDEEDIHFDVLRFLSRLRFLEPQTWPRVNRSVDRPYWLEANLREWYPELDEGWRLLKRDVTAIGEEAERIGASFAAYAIPTPHCVVGAWWNWVVPGERSGLYEPGKEVRIAEEFFREAGIINVPVAAAIRASLCPETLYFPYDGHFSPDGARLAAEVIARFLDERCLLR